MWLLCMMLVAAVATSRELGDPKKHKLPTLAPTPRVTKLPTRKPSMN